MVNSIKRYKQRDSQHPNQMIRQEHKFIYIQIIYIFLNKSYSKGYTKQTKAEYAQQFGTI